MKPSLRLAFRIATPVLLGATLVMMLHGNQVAALGLALAFFAVYVGMDTRRRPPVGPERARADEEER